MMKEGAQEYISLFTGALDTIKIVGSVQQEWLVAAEDRGANSAPGKVHLAFSGSALANAAVGLQLPLWDKQDIRCSLKQKQA